MACTLGRARWSDCYIFRACVRGLLWDIGIFERGTLASQGMRGTNRLTSPVTRNTPRSSASTNSPEHTGRTLLFSNGQWLPKFGTRRRRIFFLNLPGHQKQLLSAWQVAIAKAPVPTAGVALER